MARSEGLPPPDAYRCIWFSDDGPGWQQWHDDNDPLPDEWDEPPDEIEPYYSAAQMRAALLQKRKRPKTWEGPGEPLTATRIFNHFHRTYPDTKGAKGMFAAGVRWAEQQHGIGDKEAPNDRAERGA